MDSDLLYRLLEDASLYSEDTMHELKKITDKYPSFSLAKMMYLKNLAVLNHPDFAVELKRLSISIPDRRKLFLLIEDKLEHQSSITMVANEEREDAFALIDSFLSQHSNGSSPDLTETLNNASVSSDYMFWLMSKPDIKVEDESKVQLEHQQLIDSFIENDKVRPRRIMTLETSSDDYSDEEESTSTDFNQMQDESFFTETLAQIYIKQKRYERALQIIEKLSLKYPEKNVYFADQIRFLRKLIINNKNIK